MADGSKRCGIEGCSEPQLARGWCSMHYQRWKDKGEPGEAAPRRKASMALEVDGAPYAECPSCGLTLPLTVEHWHRSSRRATGFQGHCKRCRHERLNPEERARAARRYYRRKLAVAPGHWREVTRAWRKANPERWKAVAIAGARRRYTRKQGNGPTDVTADALMAILGAAKTCPLCSVELVREPRQPNSAEVDHVIPLNVGGPHALANLRVICRDCNLRRPKDGSDLEGDDTPRTPIPGPRPA